MNQFESRYFTSCPLLFDFIFDISMLVKFGIIDNVDYSEIYFKKAGRANYIYVAVVYRIGLIASRSNNCYILGFRLLVHHYLRTHM